MKDFYNDTDAFNKICGDCAGIDIMEITEDDIRKQAACWAEEGEFCSEEMITAAIRALVAMQ